MSNYNEKEIQIKIQKILSQFLLKEIDLDGLQSAFNTFIDPEKLILKAVLDSIDKAKIITKVKDENGEEVEHKTYDALKLSNLLKKIQKPETSLPMIENDFDLASMPLQKPLELIEGILHKGSKMSVGGASKANKTWILIDLALSVAYGKEWIGCNTQKATVLIVNFEIQREFMQSRIATIARAKGIEQTGNLDVWNLRGYNASYKDIFPKIEQRIKDNNYGLIILDPIYKLYGDTDENSAKDVAKLLNALEGLAVKTKAAIAFGSHYSKGNQAGKSSIDRVSGSGVFARDPDSLLNLTAHSQQQCFTVEAVLRNFAPLDPFVVEWNYPLFGRVELDPMDLQNKATGGRPATFNENDFIPALVEPLTTTEWKARLAHIDISKPTFFRWIKKMEKSGKIEKVDGKWQLVS